MEIFLIFLCILFSIFGAAALQEGAGIAGFFIFLLAFVFGILAMAFASEKAYVKVATGEVVCELVTQDDQTTEWSCKSIATDDD